jgi:hypothetical protein
MALDGKITHINLPSFLLSRTQARPGYMHRPYASNIHDEVIHSAQCRLTSRRLGATGRLMAPRNPTHTSPSHITAIHSAEHISPLPTDTNVQVAEQLIP